MRRLAALLMLFGCDGDLQQHMTTPAPRPASVQRLVPGALGLVGRTTSGCSTGVGLGSDVWCAFYRAGAEAGTELWVLNVSRAMNSAVACDGTSPDCLRLTTNLWTGDPLFN